MLYVVTVDAKSFKVVSVQRDVVVCVVLLGQVFLVMNYSAQPFLFWNEVADSVNVNRSAASCTNAMLFQPYALTDLFPCFALVEITFQLWPPCVSLAS